ncbi:winged helix-turn-helix domain-containing protein [Candidatus Woesearchaeota archaeon]|nr:winged helix-turn-helix domain-containing protein [Candidatus Woesearchaeota archaeon]
MEKKDSFYNLAKKILLEQKKPMHYTDLTKEILKIKATKGKTPERTVIAVMLRDTHNVFMRVGDGVFGLTKLKEQYSTKT